MDYNGEQLPFYEGFENINFSSPEWISNIGNWSVTDEVSYNGSYCLKVQNSGVAEGTKHVLESKTFDLSDLPKRISILNMPLLEKILPTMII